MVEFLFWHRHKRFLRNVRLKRLAAITYQTKFTMSAKVSQYLSKMSRWHCWPIPRQYLMFTKNPRGPLGAFYPFTLPKVNPLTKYLERTVKIIITGITVISAAAE